MAQGEDTLQAKCQVHAEPGPTLYRFLHLSLEQLAANLHASGGSIEASTGTLLLQQTNNNNWFSVNLESTHKNSTFESEEPLWRAPLGMLGPGAILCQAANVFGWPQQPVSWCPSALIPIEGECKFRFLIEANDCILFELEPNLRQLTNIISPCARSGLADLGSSIEECQFQVITNKEPHGRRTTSNEASRSGPIIKLQLECSRSRGLIFQLDMIVHESGKRLRRLLFTGQLLEVALIDEREQEQTRVLNWSEQVALMRQLDFKLMATNLVQTSEPKIWQGANLLGESSNETSKGEQQQENGALSGGANQFDHQDSNVDDVASGGAKGPGHSQRERHFVRAPILSGANSELAPIAQVSRSAADSSIIDSELYLSPAESSISGQLVAASNSTTKSLGAARTRLSSSPGIRADSRGGGGGAQLASHEYKIYLAALGATLLLSGLTSALIVLVLCSRSGDKRNQPKSSKPGSSNKNLIQEEMISSNNLTTNDSNNMTMRTSCSMQNFQNHYRPPHVISRDLSPADDVTTTTLNSRSATRSSDTLTITQVPPTGARLIRLPLETFVRFTASPGSSHHLDLLAPPKINSSDQSTLGAPSHLSSGYQLASHLSPEHTELLTAELQLFTSDEDLDGTQHGHALLTRTLDQEHHHRQLELIGGHFCAHSHNTN